MRPSLVAVGALLAGQALPASAAPVTYALDPQHSWVQFELLHFGTSTIRGRLGPAQGVVTLDREAGTGSVSIEVPTASVDTGFKPFDARIRQPDLLATDANPRAWFIASRFQLEAGQPASVRGEFTLRGNSQPLTLRALRFACRQPAAPGGTPEVCGGDFVGDLRRSDYGITFGLPLVGNEVRLSVQVEAARVIEP